MDGDRPMSGGDGVMTAATDRTVLLVSGLWFAAWALVPLLSLATGGVGYDPALVAPGTVLVVLTGLATATGRAGRGTVLVVVMALQAGLMLALSSPEALPIGYHGYTATVTVTSLSIAAGMLLPPRSARLVIVTATVVTILVWTAILAAAGRWGELWFEVPVAASYVLADGMAALTLIDALRTSARRADAAAAERAAAQEAHARDVALSEQLATAARALHESAVNTLGVIARGQVGADRAALATRARHDREVLDRLRSGVAGAAPPPWTDPGWWTRRADELGIRLHVTAAPPDLPSPADRIGAADEAALAVVHEALVNAAGHGAHEATLTTDALGPGRVRVTLRDRGPGFDPEVTPRSPVWRYLLAEASSAGVGIDVESAPGSGTTIGATWQTPPASPAPTAPARSESDADRRRGADVDATVASVATRFIAWLALPLAVSVAAAALQGDGATSLVSAALFAAVVATTLLAVRTGRPLPALLRAALVVTGPALVLLQGQADAVCGTTFIVGWSALGALIALALLAWFGRPREVALGSGLAVAAGLWWSSASSDSSCASGSLLDLVTDLIVVAAILVIRTAIVRFARRAEDAENLVLAAQRTEARRVEAGRVVADVLDRHLSETATFLDDLADGVADPDDDLTRTRARELEDSLRQVIGLGTRLEDFAPAVLRLLGRARERGVVVDLRVGDVPDAPPPALAEQVETTLGRLIDLTGPGEAVNIGVFALGDGTALTATFPPIPAPHRGGRAHRPLGVESLPDGAELEVLDLGEQQVLEATWVRL